MSNIAQSFAEEGYALVKGVYSAAERAALERDFDRIVAQLNTSREQVDATWDGSEAAGLARTGDVILHTHNVQKYARSWLNAFLAPRFLETVRQILGPDVILHHSKLVQKPAENGSPLPMHKDWPYFPTVKDSMIAAIIYVCDATDEMGCLRVWPGSHRLGRLGGANGRQQNDVIDAHPIDRTRVIQAETGYVILLHCFTLHGSMRNRSGRTKKTVLCQMYSGQDHVEPGVTHPDERMVLSGWNHHLSRGAAGLAA